MLLGETRAAARLQNSPAQTALLIVLDCLRCGLAHFDLQPLVTSESISKKAKRFGLNDELT